jgi:pyridoxal phosphate enzyme (YggS family)
MTSREQIASRYEVIRQNVAAAAAKTGRSADEITILGASKAQPLENLEAAFAAGLRVFGENRVQEALAKMESLPDEIEWHLIGPLQSNKVKKVVPAFAAVHSIDRLKIARVLDREASALGKPMLGMIEVNLAAEESKHGFLPDALLEHLPALREFESLTVAGLMAIPPYEADPQDSRKWFRQLRQLRDEVFSRDGWSERAGYLSMGMSHDYDLAVEEGATHVRVGTALFGPRGG